MANVSNLCTHEHTAEHVKYGETELFPRRLVQTLRSLHSENSTLWLEFRTLVNSTFFTPAFGLQLTEIILEIMNMTSMITGMQVSELYDSFCFTFIMEHKGYSKRWYSAVDTKYLFCSDSQDLGPDQDIE